MRSALIIWIVCLLSLSTTAFSGADYASSNVTAAFFDVGYTVPIATGLHAYSVLTHTHSIYTFAGGKLDPAIGDMARWIAEKGFDAVVFTDYAGNMQRDHLWLLGGTGAYSDENGYANFSLDGWRKDHSDPIYGEFVSEANDSELHVVATSNITNFKVAGAAIAHTYLNLNSQHVVIEFDANMTRLENKTNSSDAYADFWFKLSDTNSTDVKDVYIILAQDEPALLSTSNRLVINEPVSIGTWNHYEIDITDRIVAYWNQSTWSDGIFTFIDIQAWSRNNATIEFYIKNLRMRTRTDFGMYKADIAAAAAKYNITAIIGLETYAKNKVHPMGAFIVFPVKNWANASNMTVDSMLSYYQEDGSNFIYPQYSTLYPDQLRAYTCKYGFSEVAQGQSPLIGLNTSGWSSDLAAGCKVYAIAGANSRSRETIPPDDSVGELQTKRFWNVVLAENNSEQSILEAFRLGRFYLTNTFDITRFDFRTNDTVMGGTSNASTLLIVLASNGSTINKVTLNSPSGVIREWNQAATAFETAYGINISDDNANSAYYLTVELADGRQALSNPIWIGQAESAPNSSAAYVPTETVPQSSATYVLPIVYIIILLAVIVLIFC